MKGKSKRNSQSEDDLRPEYDLRSLLVVARGPGRKGPRTGAVRGKYAKRYREGTHLVLLDPDVHKAFRDEKTVNDALRLVIELRKVGTGRRGS